MRKATERAVLLAVDGGASTPLVLRTGSRLASAIGAPATVCTVAEFEETPRECETRLPKAEFRRMAAGSIVLPFPGFYESDDAGRAHAICEQSRRQDASIVVTGKPRKRGLFALEGTVAERVLRDCDRPVYMATGLGNADEGSVLVALATPDLGGAVLRALPLVANAGPVVLVHVIEAGLAENCLGRAPTRKKVASRMKRLRQLCLAAGLAEVSVVVRVGLPRQILRNLASEYDARLIILGRQSETGSLQALLGSVASDLVYDPPCDLLLVPSRDDRNVHRKEYSE